ncbi:MAG: hypothetical protein R2722_13430 [Tessaracoccus sp.]
MEERLIIHDPEAEPVHDLRTTSTNGRDADRVTAPAAFGEP